MYRGRGGLKRFKGPTLVVVNPTDDPSWKHAHSREKERERERERGHAWLIDHSQKREPSWNNRRPVFPVRDIDLTVNHPVTIHHDYYTIVVQSRPFFVLGLRRTAERISSWNKPGGEEGERTRIACRGESWIDMNERRSRGSVPWEPRGGEFRRKLVSKRGKKLWLWLVEEMRTHRVKIAINSIIDVSAIHLHLITSEISVRGKICTISNFNPDLWFR